MKSNLSLNLLYKHVSNESFSGYQLLHLFSEAGPVEQRSIRRLAEQFIINKYSEQQQSIFPDLEALAKFSLELCSELEAPEIFLLSTEDYNDHIGQIRDARSFREFFRRFGECIPNPEFLNAKKGVFNRFFK